jgi:predicted O-linked N-acetylglucosamine transferase (SPINDLY family)
MGVPVVTWPQDRIASRQTLAFLTELGLTDLAAASEDEYVAIAAALAADFGRRADLRRTLREQMAASPMTDGARFTPGLEAAYRQMWRRWCAGEPPEAITIEG